MCARILILAFSVCFPLASGAQAMVQVTQGDSSAVPLVSLETLSGEIWVSPYPARGRNGTASERFVVKVWFDKQWLGKDEAYVRRAKEFADSKRTELRAQVVAALKKAADDSYLAARPELEMLLEDGEIESVKRHWIVNGFSCTTTGSGIKRLKTVPGVKKIFITSDSIRNRIQATRGGGDKAIEPIVSPVVQTASKFDPTRYKHPWYCRALMAERTWREFGVTGKGTLNIVHDFNFVYPDSLKGSLSKSVGFNFNTDSQRLTVKPGSESNQDMHGTMCASIICGVGTEDCEYEFGIAPEGRWAGVIAAGRIEDSVEWAVEHSADTYSMSFSRPGLGEVRSHWRKIMEHGSFCGVYFVSGAGNFAKSESVPWQMRTPEDIPHAVFAAAGVHRDLTRTEFSSQGPVEWSTEHYRDGKVQKPEVCAFNHALPKLMLDGSVHPLALNGNSFAGPMFCGSIALMLSADPELLPWDLKEIITSTATDVGPEGVDFETGHGLINCYRAVKEVLRRKAIREGVDASPFTGRSNHDELDQAQYEIALSARDLIVGRVVRNSPAQVGGLKPGDVLIELNGEPVTTESQLRTELRQLRLKSVIIKVRRKQQVIELRIGSGGKGLGSVFEQFRAGVFK